MQIGNSGRTSQASVSAALAAVSRESASRLLFPGEDGGRSLAAMAQQDLDAALQLLTDRAQYITGSTGAAIALRRSGKNDMLCRASTGSNAPELGTLLSTEFGLSGESVRTRRALRCDDAERDARVNQEVCRQIGIASVVVMPVVHDDEVMGVFELFSGRANAFGERDLSALRRLSEMVETAVTLARAAEEFPERLHRPIEQNQVHHSGEMLAEPALDQDPVLEIETELALEEPPVVPPAPQRISASAPMVEPASHHFSTSPTKADAPAPKVEPIIPAPPSNQGAPAMEPDLAPGRKPLLWSAAMNLNDTSAGDSDQSHIPPAFRSLRKCDSCGFPVSAERSLCVECEEKKWRGQLRAPRGTVTSSSGTGAAAAPAPAVAKLVATSAPIPTGASKAKEISTAAPIAVPDPPAVGIEPLEDRSSAATLVFSAGLEPSQSWLAKNKFIIGALLVVLGTAAAIVLLGHI